MLHAKKDVMSVEKSKVNLKIDFNVNDIIDILVSEQEENIEKGIKNSQLELKKAQTELKRCNDNVEDYMEKFVREKYGAQIKTLEATLKSMGANATVQFEIIDGCEMPQPHRRHTMFSSKKSKPDDTSKLVVALVICNRAFDKDTVDNTVSFYIDCKYDKKLKQLNEVKEEALQKVSEIQKQIHEAQNKLRETGRLVRKAKAAVTKKAIGKEVDDLVADFRQQFPQIELKTK